MLKQLHEIGDLTDNPLPDIVVEEAEAEAEAVAEELGSELYVDEQANYVPPELVSHYANDSEKLYYSYLIELKRNYEYDILVQDIVLVVRTKLDFDDENMNFELEVDGGYLTVHMMYVEEVSLNSEQVLLCQRFQITLFRVLLDHKLDKLNEVLAACHLRDDRAVFDYLLLPSTSSRCNQEMIDWKCVSSVLFHSENSLDCPNNSSHPKGFGFGVHTKNGLVCSYMLENSLVSTPHNGKLYCITGTLKDLNGNSVLKLKDGEVITYKKHYKSQYGIDLQFEGEKLLNGRHLFQVPNYLQRCRHQKEKGASNTTVELPPELCDIIMSPISIATFYSFSFIPSIMHRVESLLIAENFKKMHLDHCTQNVVIPTIKVLEALTTKNCQEKFHLESLETLGDSFLKYAASQQLFKTYQNHDEGMLTSEKEKIISNAALCKRGCDRKLPGFIRDARFDPKKWIDESRNCMLEEVFLSTTRKVYNRGERKIKSKRIADVVEALIGVFLSTGGELAAIRFMDWLGIKVDFVNIPYERNFPAQPENLVNIRHLEPLLNYTFCDASLLVEALTHGSYIRPEIPICYQRLEFLGDSVLDYLITMHLYDKYPGLSPEMLTDLRSASVNNECYALSVVKAELHKHILHASQELDKNINITVHNFEQLSLESTFGWESESSFSEVLGDIMESLAGAILVDSGYNKEIVFQSIRPLLEPMITPDSEAQSC